jgi:hypothetical protein
MILIKVENLFLGDCIIEAALNRDFSGFYRTGLTSFRGGGFCRLRLIQLRMQHALSSRLFCGINFQ